MDRKKKAGRQYLKEAEMCLCEPSLATSRVFGLVSGGWLHVLAPILALCGPPELQKWPSEQFQACASDLNQRAQEKSSVHLKGPAFAFEPASKALCSGP